MAKNNVTKILLVALVLLLAAGVWGYKTLLPDPTSPALHGDDSVQVDSVRESFEVSTIDLDKLKSRGLPLIINFSGDG